MVIRLWRIAIVLALALLICPAAHAIRVKPSYEEGKQQFYGISVTTSLLGNKAKATGEPILRAATVVKTTVIKVLPDGSVKISLQPLGVVLNGKNLSLAEQLGDPVVVKLNRYGKAIAFEMPASKYTPAKTVDLQPYLSREWRNKTMIPDRELQQGETWSYMAGNSENQSGSGSFKVKMASVNEKHNGLTCCRFEGSGMGRIEFGEAIALALANGGSRLPTAVVDKCREYAGGVNGNSKTTTEGKHWVSLEDGGVVESRGTTRTTVNIRTGEPLQSRRLGFTLESKSLFKRLTEAEISSFLASASNVAMNPFYHQTSAVNCSGPTEPYSFQSVLNLGINPTYTSVVVGISLPDILPFGGPLELIDCSIKVHGRLMPNGDDFTNLQASFGFKAPLGLPIIDFINLFVGKGACWGNLAENVKPGSMSLGLSTAFLLVGSNLTPSSAEIGITTSLLQVSLAASVSLMNMSKGARGVGAYEMARDSATSPNIAPSNRL